MYENGNECLRNPWTGETTRKNNQFSRAVEYSLDLEHHEAVFVRQHSLNSTFNTFSNATGLVVPMENGNWLISWGCDSAFVNNPPHESLTEVDPESNIELMNIRIEDSNGVRRTSRAYPLRQDEFRAERIALTVELTEVDENGLEASRLPVPGQVRTVRATFTRPVVDIAVGTPSIRVVGATIRGVRPLIAPGEPENSYVVSLAPDGDGPITLSVIDLQSCALRAICAADGTPITDSTQITLSPVYGGHYSNGPLLISPHHAVALFLLGKDSLR